jgi:hypothetical protein
VRADQLALNLLAQQYQYSAFQAPLGQRASTQASTCKNGKTRLP